MLRTLLFAMALLVAFGCGNSPVDPGAAIVIADETVSYQELEQLLGRCGGDSVLVEITLNNLLNSRLVLVDARNRGLNETPSILRFAYEKEGEQIRNIWLARILEEKIVLPPDTVKEYYDQLGTMVIYTVMNVRDSLLCDSLRQLALSGANLGNLVMDHTSIPFDAHIRGIVGPIDMMRTSLIDMDLLAGLEQGRISRMDLFPSGWRFLRVDSIYQEEVEPFEDISDFLGHHILSDIRDDYEEVLKDSLSIVYNLTVTDGIPDLVAEHALDNLGEYFPYTEGELSLNAYTFNGGSRSLLGLVENIASLPQAMPKFPTNPEWIEDYCRILGLYDIMAMEGRALGMDTLPEVISEVERRVSRHVLDLYYEQVIEPRLIPTEEEIEQAYTENSLTLVIPEKRVFEVIGAIGVGQIEVLSRIVALGEEPFTRAEELTHLAEFTARGESLLTPAMTISELYPPWDSLLFSAEIGEMLFCTVSTERILVFRPVELIPERAAELEEARDQLADLLIGEREEEVVSALVDSLRSIYRYQVDRDFVNGFIIEGAEPDQEPVSEMQYAPVDSQSTD